MRMEAKSFRIDVEKVNGLSKASSVEPSQRRIESVALSSLRFKKERDRKRGLSSFRLSLLPRAFSLLGFSI